MILIFSMGGKFTRFDDSILLDSAPCHVVNNPFYPRRNLHYLGEEEKEKNEKEWGKKLILCLAC